MVSLLEGPQPVVGNTPDVVILETEVPAVQQKNYDFLGDVLEADVLMFFRQVLREEESLLKVGAQAQFGYLPTMTLSNIVVMNTESFCERILSCASLVVTDLHTSLDKGMLPVCFWSHRYRLYPVKWLTGTGSSW